MRHRALRVTLVLLAVATIGAAVYVIVREERLIAAIRLDLERVERDARDLQVLGSDLRAAQQSYVAAGQGDAFWMQRVTALLSRLDVELSDFEHVAESDDTRAAIAAARAAVDRFRKVDRRARDYLAARQHLLASDTIFADGIEATTALTGRIDTARTAEITTREVKLRKARHVEAWTLGGAASVCLLMLLLLAPSPRVAGRDRSETSHEAEATSEEPNELYITTPPQAARKELPAVDVDLASAAGLCTDLGRVIETRELLALLERAGTLLGASGLILWIADRAGAELRPVLAQGYAEDIVTRLGAIPRDADNAAAAAFRKIETQTVPGEAGSSGAIVAPLITAAGCVGVLAIETQNGFERLSSVRALATIFAAQLATMVSTDPPAASIMGQAQA